MPHRIVDKADVRAPASFASVYRLQFLLPLMVRPKPPEIIIVVGEGSEFLA
jgi:hypothetical protein